MNCATVRDQLVDHSLGTLPRDDARALDRHLVWCAACRKEAGELERAAATLVFALAPAEPAPALEDQVVATVDRTARRRAPRGPRRGRLAAAAAVAAMLAVSALGWGAAMTGRAARAEERMQQVQQDQDEIVGRFRRFTDVLTSEGLSDPENRVFIGSLTPADGGTAGGAALTLASPSGRDLVMVMVSGLGSTERSGGPYQVFLVGEQNRRLFVGKIRAAELGDGGAATIWKQEDFDVSRYTGVEIHDASGAAVLTGSVSLRTTIPSPSP